MVWSPVVRDLCLGILQTEDYNLGNYNPGAYNLRPASTVHGHAKHKSGPGGMRSSDSRTKQKQTKQTKKHTSGGP